VIVTVQEKKSEYSARTRNRGKLKQNKDFPSIRRTRTPSLTIPQRRRKHRYPRARKVQTQPLQDPPTPEHPATTIVKSYRIPASIPEQMFLYEEHAKIIDVLIDNLIRKQQCGGSRDHHPPTKSPKNSVSFYFPNSFPNLSPLILPSFLPFPPRLKFRIPI
jgi:hypothetical protein